MRSNWIVPALVLGLATLVAGCGKADSTGKPPAKGDPEPEHHHGKGPNGGVIFDLGKYHAEFTVDHDKKECRVLVVDGENETAKPLAVKANEFTLVTKPTRTKDGKDVPAMTIKLMAKDAKDGKASAFTGSDPGLGNVADFEGNVVGVIDGKPSPGEFKE